MFTKKELEATAEIARKKKADVLNSKSGSDLDYFRSLETLTRLEGAANDALKSEQEPTA